MAAKKQHGNPANLEKFKGVTTMLIRNVIPAEEFLKAYGKYNQTPGGGRHGLGHMPIKPRVYKRDNIV